MAWIFTKEGFFSLVQHRDDPDVLMVRARVESDLYDLAKFVDVSPKVIETKSGDYRWRMDFKREVLANALYASVMDIDYTTSVKTALDKGEPKRHSAMMGVWTAMMRLQEGGRYNRSAQTKLPLPTGDGGLGLGSIIERHWAEGAALDSFDGDDEDLFDDVGVCGVTEVVTLGGPRWTVQIADPHGNTVDVVELDDEDRAYDLADAINAYVDAWL